MPINNNVKVYWMPSTAPLADGSGGALTWTEITSKVRSISINSGRSASFDQYEPARASIVVDNRAGTIAATAWYRWRQIKVESVGATTNVLFRGFIQEIQHDQSNAPFDAVAIIEAEDLLAILARKEVALGGPFGTDVPQETTTARVGTILDDALIPPGFRGTLQSSTILMSEPSATVNDKDTAGVLVGNALELLRECVDAEMGALYCDHGLLQFENRYALVDRTRAPASYLTFSDTATGSEIRFLRGALTLVPTGTDYRNVVQYTGTSGNVKRASSIPASFPEDTLSYTVPLAIDEQALGNATGLLTVYKQQETWPAELVVQTYPGTNARIDAMGGLSMRDYCVVKFTPVGVAQRTYKVFVAGIDHAIDPSGWRTTIRFESADRWYDAWGATDFLVLNSATKGQLDQEAVAY